VSRDRTRRSILVGGAAAALAGGTWQWLRRRVGLAERRGPGRLLPFITPEDDFYVFAKYGFPEEQPLSQLQLTLSGPDRRVSVPWAEVLALPSQTRTLTLCCDGNGFLPSSMPLAGDIARNWRWRFSAIGTAEWRVVSIKELFARYDVPLVGPCLRSSARDGEDFFHPIDSILADEVVLAVGMNGGPLPHLRGFPGRLLALGQYGVPSVKWVSELGSGENVPASWRNLETGTSQYVPVQPVAFVTSPVEGEVVHDARVEVVGATYAGRHPVREVRVAVDDGPGVLAELLEPAQPFVWSRWRAEVALSPGRHQLHVSCVDAVGRYSTTSSARAPREPDGFGGIHTIRVSRA